MQVSDENILSRKPRNPQISETLNHEHFSRFKGEMRKIINGYNKIKLPNLTKVKGKIANHLPCVKVALNPTLNVSALLDTGTSKNVMSKELYNKLSSQKLIIN